MKISFYTLGCKLNQAETDDLKKELLKKGFLIAPWGEKTDVAIVRACGVTMGASQTTREIIRSANRNGALVIATGCLENNDLPEINFGAKTNEEIIDFLLNLKQECKTSDFKSKKTDVDKTRAFIKIQNGCNFNCAYCIIPHFRGRSLSIDPKIIIEKIKTAHADGYKEVVLTGVNIGLYNYQKINLTAFLKLVLQKTKIERIRLGSLDPRLITSDFIKLYKNPRLLPHMHLSLQSGSDSVLKNMNRNYTAQKYYKIVELARALNPLFSFTTDIIVGFPGETEQDFADSCEFVKKVGFAKVHVFPFSPRPKTPAAEMKNKVQDKIKTERVKKLIALSKKVGEEFAKKFEGKTRPVLFENKKSGFWFGYTPEYLRIKKTASQNLENKIKPVKFSSKKDILITKKRPD